MLIRPNHPVEILHYHVCCGIGAGARGFNRAGARVNNLEAKFRCIGGVDVDPLAIRDFTRLAGVQGTVLDLFSREQYIAFHGHEPPRDWREATPDDIRRSAHGERPHIIFTSMPCKGFSGLLSENMSKSAKYQALNGLTLRGMWLVLEAWKDDLPELFIFENVPRISARGRHLLDQIVALLRAYGYAVAETKHNCGELGGLAQSRERFLLVARHMEKVPPFLYEPVKKSLRGVGEVLQYMPLPGDPIGGPMHRIPRLQWKTWVRLAFVEAGGDWRSLSRLRVEDGVLADYGILPARDWNDGTLGVLRWGGPAGTITGNPIPTAGRFSVADPRAYSSREGTGFLGVNTWGKNMGAVTANGRPGAGAFSVADPRPDLSPDTHKNVYRVVRNDQSAGVVTSGHGPSSGGQSVADPRMGATGPRFNNVYRVVRFDGHAQAVTGGDGPTSGGQAVADPRAAAGCFSKYAITKWGGTARTVLSGSTTGQGAFAVADPRCNWNPGAHQSKLRVYPFNKHTGAITGSASSAHGFTSGAMSVADPRPGYPDSTHLNILAVTPYKGTAKTVTGANHVTGGAQCVADPRPEYLRNGRDKYMTAGMYGVQGWDETSGAVAAQGQHDNGRWSVADPRIPETSAEDFSLPAPDERLEAIIIAEDNTWHRPFTTLELAALQTLFDPEELFEFDADHGVWKIRQEGPWTLAGESDSRHREGIGNAVPSDAAEAIGGVMGTTLLLAWSGQTFALGNTPIWVQPLAIALSVQPQEWPSGWDL